MATPINIPVNAQLQNVTQLQRQIQQATQNLRINLISGNSARSLTALSQPLGRLTGQADEFSKSLDAANARVLAFGASVGVVNTLSNAFKALVSSTIEVEKAITAISVVGDQFAGKNKQLSQGLFAVAKATGQSFAEVSKAALEFSRQGLNLEQTLQRTQDALVLTRLTGLDAAKSVDGLTASVNAFSKAGLSTTQILNKLAAVDQAFAVSSADLIEGFNRSAAVAQNAGVTFDELAGIITALQQETSRGGAVIGNALKTIFTRLQDTSTLNQLQNLGVAVQDLEGNLLPARQILQNLAKDVEGLGQITRAGIFKDVAGTFQINQLISLVSDLGKANSVTAKATQVSAGATNEAFIANEKLNQSLDAILNKVANTGKQLGALLGEIGLTDNLKGLLDGINSFLEGVTNILQGDDLGAKFAKGIVKGIGSVLSGPGVIVFAAIIAKLTIDVAKFGAQSLKTFFGIGQAARDQQQVQESIVQTLIRNQSVLNQILNTQGGQNAQAQAFLNILKQEEQVLQNIRTIAGGIAAPLVAQGYRAGAQGIQRRSAGGYLPAQEAADVRRGIGGASPSSQVVAIPNFAFGGGKRGTMIANTSEYIVPNYAGGGSAIFNQDMAKTMGLPPGAKKITAAGGFIPNFAPTNVSKQFAVITNDDNLAGPKLITAKPNKKEYEGDGYDLFLYGIPRKKLNEQNTGFRNEQLIDKYRKYAIEDAKNYALAVGGRSLQPYEIEKVSNEGALAGLIGAIFEDGIGGVISSPTLRQKQAERRVNEKIDFRNQKDINKFYGIDPSVEYIEAKYSQNVSGLSTSVGNKIFNTLQGSVAGEIIKRETSGQGGRPLKIRKDNFLNQLLLVRGRNFQAQGLSKDQIEQLKRAGGFQTNASRGYIPNFAASALMDAISREKSAGLSASQIYVDQSPALKSSSNPMGLMVANRRDEPAGGFQGIARARKEGRDPKTYGAANGFIPNFAPAPTSSTSASPAVEKGLGDLAGKFIVLQGALTFLQGGFTEAGSTAAKLNQGLQTLTAAFFAYQAVQEFSVKTLAQTSSSLGNFSKKLNKFSNDVVLSGRARASAISRGANPIGGSFGARIGGRLGSGRIGDFLRNRIGGVAQSISGGQAGLSGALKSFGAAAAAGVVALKGFNDIAALFYTRSPQLDKSFELLSSASSKVAGSLSDLDRASAKAAAGSLGNVGIGAKIIGGLSSLNPLNLGRNTVQYQAAGQTQTVTLEGGQTGEDFEKLKSELAPLIFADLKNQFPNAGQAYYETQTETGLAELFGRATSGGRLDLSKVINSDYVQRLQKEAEDTQTQLERAANKVAQDKPFAKLAASIESIISETNKVFNEELNRLNNFSETIKAVQASKAFSNLNLEQQLSANLISSSSEFEKTFRERQLKIVQDAQKLILDKLPKIVEGEPFRTGEKLTTDLKNAKTVDEVSFILDKFKTALEGIDSSKIPEFTTALSEATNEIATYNSNLETSRNILQLQQQELIATTKAEIEFRNKFLDFSNSVGETERSLIKFRGQLERIDIQRESNIAIRSSFATSRQQALNIRREETLGGLSEKAGAEANIALQEALNEARKQSFTKENFVALNLNTEAIKTLTQAILQEKGENIQDQINKLETFVQEAKARFMGSGVTSEDAQKQALALTMTGDKLNIGQRLEYLRNAQGILGNQGNNQDNTIAPSDVSKISESLFGPKSNIGQLAKESASLQDFVAKTAEQFKLSEQAALLFQPQLINIYNSLKSQAATAAEQALTAKARLDADQNLLNATNNYRATLSATATDIETRLATQPMSQGEFLRARAEQRVTNRELNMTDEQVREDRSSFRRGFEDSITEIQAKTADFKNEIGREIPKLFSDNLAQGLNDAISGAKSLKDALRDAATSFFQAITQRNIQNLADIFTGGIGGFFTKKASGGLISGGSGTKDDVPAMLMGGEYVIKKSAVKKYGSGFFDALNKGGVKGFANGGGVQSGAGGFYVPGDYDEGSISGKGNLLAFAGQSFTSGQYDRFGSTSLGGASVSLEAESARLTAFGRENSPLFERVQQSKEEAFKVYLDQLNQEKQYRDQLKQMEEAEKQRQKQLVTSVVSAVATAVLSAAASAGAAGFKNAAGLAKANNAGLGGQFAAGIGGIFKGSGGYGGIGNIFKGTGFTDFSKLAAASGMKQPDFLMQGGTLKGINVGNVTYLPKNFSSSSNYFKSPNAEVLSTYGDYEFVNGQYRRLNYGGYVNGGSGLRDDVPAMLTGGEFVLNNRATRKLGVQNLNRLNAGETVGGEDRSGAVTESLLSKLDELIQATRESSSENVVVNVSSSEAQGPTENTGGTEKELQRKIRQAVLDVIAQEKRLGGSLNKDNR